MFTASELYGLAIQVEMNGERIYRNAAGKVTRDSLREILGWLADEEMRHQGEFLKIKQKVDDQSESGRSTSGMSDDESMILRMAMGRHAFSLDDLEAQSIPGEKELLETAILFEEDAIQFFDFIAGFLSDATALACIEAIRREELDHKRLLAEKLSELER